MNIVAFVLAICAAIAFLCGIIQAMVALKDIITHSVQSGQQKRWIVIMLIFVVLTVIFAGASYASLLKSDNSSPSQSTTATSTSAAPRLTSTLTTTSVPTPTTALQTPTQVSSTPTVAPEVEAWTGTITVESSLIYTYYAEFHVTNVGQAASFQGTWCEDLTDQKDIYGHSVCTDSMPISGTWVAFNMLGASLQTDINNKYPYTTHNPIIIWSGQGGIGQGGLCQDCRHYAFIQNNILKGLVYSANGSGPHGTFTLTLQGSGASKLGS